MKFSLHLNCDGIIDSEIYAVNWCVSRWNGRDTMDVIIFFISRPGGLTREKVKNYFFLIQLFFKLDSTRRKASEICLRPPLDIYSHTFSR